MKKKEHPFTGNWYAAAQDTRNAGKWKREYEFAPHDWMICFLANGHYIEIFNPEDDRCLCYWVANDRTGIISILTDEPRATIMKCVFRREGRNRYLYCCEDLPHIPENASALVEHHAHTRLKLMEVEQQERL